MRGPVAEPLQIEYKNWRHKERRYWVVVVEVLNFRGKHGFNTSVVVEHKGLTGTRSWPAKVFLETFEPMGRRMRRKSRYDLLRDD